MDVSGGGPGVARVRAEVAAWAGGHGIGRPAVEVVDIPGGDPGSVGALSFGVRTGQGDRDYQQDSALTGAVAGVADGLGGGPAGDVASGLTVRELAEVAEGAGPADLLGGVAAAQGRLLAEAPVGSATTLVAGVVRDGVLTVVNVGDSRAYLVRAGESEARQLTVDQETADGLLTQALSGPGWDRTVVPQLVAVELAPGDTVLYVSDGVFQALPDGREALSPRELAALVTTDPQRTATAIHDAARERTAPTGMGDNVTVVAVRVGGHGETLDGLRGTVRVLPDGTADESGTPSPALDAVVRDSTPVAPAPPVAVPVSMYRSALVAAILRDVPDAAGTLFDFADERAMAHLVLGDPPNLRLSREYTVLSGLLDGPGPVDREALVRCHNRITWLERQFVRLALDVEAGWEPPAADNGADGRTVAPDTDGDRPADAQGGPRPSTSDGPGIGRRRLLNWYDVPLGDTDDPPDPSGTGR
ncbi:PP2C family protein-serine/threonine phosphatase [Actinocatenispora rupis]|uniref:PP2C family protein-serine/threonine phosphatase n=1 Tax=Actinocatenispora rupis TaxID=519421 RepID=UPI0019436C85|nr:PP2C family serine/threonine-protein phosphatase [Actinocatenispora rupis]